MREFMVFRENVVLLVIDIQDKFRPVIPGISSVIANTAKLVQAFQVFNVPVVVTEQYPGKLGTTVKEIRDVLSGNDHIEKVYFDCFCEQSFARLLKKKYKKKKILVICGIEAHVCIFQTALDALSRGYEVHLVTDAVSSRKRVDHETALKRLATEGVKLATSEMLIFQMMRDAKEAHFKEISRIVKGK